MKISENFDRSEFKCACGCGFDTVDAELLEILEDLRYYFRRPVIITSAARCRKHNSSPEVGSNDNSQHVLGKAADIRINGEPPMHVAEYLENRYPRSCGIGRYSDFTHIDSRDEKARWSKV